MQAELVMKRSFNPNMVRLAPSAVQAIPRSSTGFNPNMVRLALSLVWARRGKQSRFNPNMVRLARDCGQQGEWVLLEFQSQYGSIRTGLYPANRAASL